MTDLTFMDATGQAELVRTGKASPPELLEEALRQIAELNPQLNAVVHPMGDRACAALAAGVPTGPFSGVPMVLKDLMQEVEGEPFYEGMQYLGDLDYRPPATFELTRRFEAAGLMICAKTNTPELGGIPTTEPLAFGPTHNPWDPTRTPGGSSGGSAACVAAGIVPIGHANDAGGSIRVPAARCGLVGLKPTRGRTPLGPLYGDLFAGVVSEGVVTRTVRDTAGVLDAVHGPDVGDPYAAPPPLRPYVEELTGEVAPLRIGVWSGVPGGRSVLSPEATNAVAVTAAALESLGHHLDDEHPAALDGPEAGTTLGGIVMVGTDWAIRRWERITGVPVEPEQLEPITRRYLEYSATVSGAQLFDLIEQGQLITRAVDQWYADGHDLLLMATVAEPSNPLGELQAATDDDVPRALKALLPTLWLNCWVNLTGQPSISLPMHWTQDGLPMGAQLIARPGREDQLLAVAAQLEQAMPWAHRRPPISVS
ncbi:MAG: amidase [Actinomycetota bacterium]|nr:amidase [Actinomycetota bacterium]